MSWTEIFKEEKQKDYYVNLQNKLVEDSKLYTIYPLKNNLFTAFNMTPLDEVKVII